MTKEEYKKVRREAIRDTILMFAMSSLFAGMLLYGIIF